MENLEKTNKMLDALEKISKEIKVPRPFEIRVETTLESCVIRSSVFVYGGELNGSIRPILPVPTNCSVFTRLKKKTVGKREFLFSEAELIFPKKDNNNELEKLNRIAKLFHSCHKDIIGTKLQIQNSQNLLNFLINEEDESDQAESN